MQEEKWVPAPNFEGLYEVSNFGNLRTVTKISVIKRGKYRDKEVGLKRKIPSLMKKTGYLKITLAKNSKPYTVLVHRLVAMAFIENPNNLPQVNHKDGDKTNNHVDNLEWCTAKENVQHGVKNGLRGDVSGVKNPMSKLTPELVMEIYGKTGTYQEIADIYNISKITVFDIKHGRRWSKLTNHVYQKIYNK